MPKAKKPRLNEPGPQYPPELEKQVEEIMNSQDQTVQPGTAPEVSAFISEAGNDTTPSGTSRTSVVVDTSPSADGEPTTAPEVPGAEAVQRVEPAAIETKRVADPAIAAGRVTKTSVAPQAGLSQTGGQATSRQPSGHQNRLRAFLSAWRHSRRAKFWTFIILFLAVVALALLPTTRYYGLNMAGVRASASLTVLDNSTQQPLKNVQVQIGNQTAITDVEGKARLGHLRLGSAQMVIHKRAFADDTRRLTIGWGSNPLSQAALTPTGSQYTFLLSDFLSGKPVTKAEASSSDAASAVTDDQGKIVLTVDSTGADTLPVTITADNYRSEKLTLDLNSKVAHSLKMVPAGKEVFISKRSGKYDLYKVDIDGKNEKLILPGSGTEKDAIALLPHPAGDVAALVSTRENVRDVDGFLLSTLNIVDLKSGQTNRAGQAEQIQLVGWFGDRLVYVQTTAGASAASPNRNRLLSYDQSTGEVKQLAAANYFNDVLGANGQIFYAPSGNSVADSSARLFRVNADGSGLQTVVDREVYNIFRTAYDSISVSAGQDWYGYHFGDAAANKSDAPPNPTSRLYIDAPAGPKKSLWVDNRDGKGVLLLYDANTKTDKTLQTASGLSYPVRWLNGKVLIYRVQTEDESADYVMSLDGGSPVKIRDVTPTTTVIRGY